MKKKDWYTVEGKEEGGMHIDILASKKKMVGPVPVLLLFLSSQLSLHLFPIQVFFWPALSLSLQSNTL